MRKIYVASAFGDHAETRRAQQLLLKAGFVIVHDWCRAAAEYPNDDAPADVRRSAALDCLHAVETSDVVLLITSERVARGAWIEAGAALALGIDLVIVGPQRDASVFGELAASRFETLEEACAHLAALRRDVA